MTRYDVMDDMVIEATPEEIAAALDDEAAGRSQWWLPWLRMKHREGTPDDGVGAEWDVEVDTHGKVGGWTSTRFAERMVESEPGRRSVQEYIGGAFTGRLEMTTQVVDPTHTRIVARWQTDPRGLMRLLARFVDVPAGHSTVMQHGFRQMEAYLAERRSAAA